MRFLFFIFSMSCPAVLLASDISLPGVTVSISDTSDDLSTPLQILALMTILSLAPAILIMMTSFTRIIIVLAMLRLALGTQQTPSNMVMVSLALFLTLFTMMPVINDINDNAFTPYTQKTLTSEKAIEKAMDSMKAFMIKHTREKDLALMIEFSGKEMPTTPEDVRYESLLPAFMLSELQTAFQIGFVIFLPFLLIDIVVASVLMSMGMILLPPLTISLPIKILMFVLIEGWVLVARALVGSFI